ncbi:MAG: cupin domain-containing protein [Acidimicrobiales bacterium]|nr:cupin domain-containing protein [Acidimicrobiales bacterium]
MNEPLITRPGEGLTFTTSPTDQMTFLCQGDEVMPDVMVERLAPGDGPPLHSHPWAGWDVVTRGEVRFHVDGETFDLKAGSFIYTPADAVHAFMAIGDEHAEIVQYQWPGGFHIVYADIAEVFADGPPDPQALAEVADRHGFTLHGPPLSALEAGV